MDSQLDIAFVIDTTGSMGSCIEQVKQNVKKIVNDISSLVSCNNIRCAVIGYKDHCDPEVVKVHCEFTSNMSTVQSAVNQLQPSGGGDFPEAVTDGLYQVPRLAWRVNAVKTVVLMGDAPPHGCNGSGDNYPQGCPCKEEWTEQVQACREMGIVIHTVNCTNADLPSFEKIAKDTFGQYIVLSGQTTVLSSVVTGVAQVDFDKYRIANAVDAKINTSYLRLQTMRNEKERLEWLASLLSKEQVKTVNKKYKIEKRGILPSDIEQAIIILNKQSRNQYVSILFPDKTNAVGKTEGGLFSSILDKEGNKTIVPLQSVEVSVHIQHGSASVEISQTYFNESKDAIECSYQFPVDDLAAVCGFTAEIDGKKIIAKCMEKQKAQEKYDDSIASGHGAFLLEQKRSDVFSMSVGNLLPKQQVTIRINYITPVEQNEAGIFRFVLPTTVAPKYSPPSLIQQQQNENEEPTMVSKAPYKLAVNMDIEMPSDLKEITSPTHDIQVNSTGNKASVSLKDAELNSDFVVLLTQKQDEPFQFFLETHQSVNNNSQDRALLISVKPTFNTEKPASKRDIVLVIDCSSSMIGSQMDEAKKAAYHFLSSLKSRGEVQFNIISFGSDAEAVFSTNRGFSAKNESAANTFISDLEPTKGGTQLLKALEKVKTVSHGSKQVEVILLSDGQLTDDQRVSKVVLERSQEGFHFFTIGVGLAINYNVIRGLARIGQGASEFRISGETEPISVKLDRHLSRIFNSAGSVECDWGALTEVFPFRLPPIINNTRLTFYAFLGNSIDLSKPIHLKISSDNFTYEIEVSLSDLTATVSGQGKVQVKKLEKNLIHLLAGRELIREYEESKLVSRTCPIDSNRVVAMATSLNLASSLTSFVAVDERNEAQTTTLKKKDVPVSAPKKDVSSYESYPSLSSSVERSSARNMYKAAASYHAIPSSICLDSAPRQQAAGCCGGGSCNISSSSYPPTSSYSAPRNNYSKTSPKVVMIGESAAGKSSILTRFIFDTFSVSESTIGAAFQTKTLQVSNQEIKLLCWDTAGQERFRSLSPIYLRGADVALIVFDLTSKESYEQAVKYWLREVRKLVGEDILLFLIGNKTDIRLPTQEEREEYQSFAESVGVTFFECSAKTGEGVDIIFQTIAQRLLDQ